jgi:hypothetical protein
MLIGPLLLDNNGPYSSIPQLKLKLNLNLNLNLKLKLKPHAAVKVHEVDVRHVINARQFHAAAGSF